MSRWASAALDRDSSKVFSALEEGLNVGLIASYELNCCGADDDLATAVRRRDLRDFDHVPVTDGEHIVGLLNRARFEQRPRPPGTQVEEVTERLCEDLLISSEAGILSYVEQAGEHPCRLVLRGSSLDGIVTLSDLHKLPVRPALFMLVTHVELLMARWIRAVHPVDESLLTLLSQGRRDKAEEEWIRQKEDNFEVDLLTATHFSDKRELLLELRFPLRNEEQARAELEGIEHHLRNPVAHAGEYAHSPEAARETVEAVKNARRWIQDIERELYGAVGDPLRVDPKADG
jgi:CBS domain-containing protein